MTVKEKFEMICEKLNINEYWEAGYKGKGIKIATMESMKRNGQNDHGYKVYRTIKTYAPEVEVISFNDTFGKSSIGDDGTNCNFIEFVDWCIDNKVNIVTSSVGWSADKEVEKEAVKKLYEAGIIYFNCAGNTGEEDTLGQGKEASNIDIGVISVSGLAIDSKGKESWAGYDYGNAIDVVTYSVGVPYQDELGNWNNWDGTSAGTPLMASATAIALCTGASLDSKNMMRYINTYSFVIMHEGHIYNKFVLPPIAFTKTFEQEDWEVEFKTSWERATELGIVDGTRPYDNITRNELIVILDRLGLIKE